MEEKEDVEGRVRTQSGDGIPPGHGFESRSTATPISSARNIVQYMGILVLYKAERKRVRLSNTERRMSSVEYRPHISTLGQGVEGVTHENGINESDRALAEEDALIVDEREDGSDHGCRSRCSKDQREPAVERQDVIRADLTAKTTKKSIDHGRQQSTHTTFAKVKEKTKSTHPLAEISGYPLTACELLYCSDVYEGLYFAKYPAWASFW